MMLGPLRLTFVCLLSRSLGLDQLDGNVPRHSLGHVGAAARSRPARLAGHLVSRGVVLAAILGDSRLRAKGFNQDNVCVAYDKEQRPSDQMFMVLRYGTQNVDQAIQRG